MYYKIDGFLHHWFPIVHKTRFGMWICDRADYEIWLGIPGFDYLTFKDFRKEHCNGR
jgi:hypothetical protein